MKELQKVAATMAMFAISTAWAAKDCVTGNPQCCDEAPSVISAITGGKIINGCAGVGLYCPVSKLARKKCCKTCTPPNSPSEDPEPVDSCLVDNPGCCDESIEFISDLTNGYINNGCADVGSYCSAPGAAGNLANIHCCKTCNPSNEDPDPEMSLPPPDNNDPVHLFMLGGQSNCVGQASIERLENHSPASDYESYLGEQEGVWFAGMRNEGENFLIHPVYPGVEKDTTFGPEVAVGQHYRNLTGHRVMIVKYCWSGSNVELEWNPASPFNQWDVAEDDGTAAFLSSKKNYNSKKHLFVNFAHTVRLAVEALEEAGVAYEWKGIYWLQGLSDAQRTYQQFGQDTANVWNGIRQKILPNIWDLPIVDTGSSGLAVLRSGKEYAATIVEDCNVAFASADVGIINPLGLVSFELIIEYDAFEFYGYDPKIGQGNNGPRKPINATDKEFAWYINYPVDLHAEYEAQILQSEMLVNEYLRTFTSISIPSEVDARDPWIQFPLAKCAPNEPPTNSDDICWEDFRSPTEQELECSAGVALA